jgi:hypothetical protein
MAPRFLTTLTGRDLPQIRQPREPEPSTINEKTIADFTRLVEQTGILEPAVSKGGWSASRRIGISHMAPKYHPTPLSG